MAESPGGQSVGCVPSPAMPPPDRLMLSCSSMVSRQCGGRNNTGRALRVQQGTLKDTRGQRTDRMLMGRDRVPGCSPMPAGACQVLLGPPWKPRPRPRPWMRDGCARSRDMTVLSFCRDFILPAFIMGFMWTFMLFFHFVRSLYSDQ